MLLVFLVVWGAGYLFVNETQSLTNWSITGITVLVVVMLAGSPVKEIVEYLWAKKQVNYHFEVKKSSRQRRELFYIKNLI